MMNVKVKVYNGVKYNANSEKVAEVEYNNIRGYEVVTGERATEIDLRQTRTAETSTTSI